MKKVSKETIGILLAAVVFVLIVPIAILAMRTPGDQEVVLTSTIEEGVETPDEYPYEDEYGLEDEDYIELETSDEQENDEELELSVLVEAQNGTAFAFALPSFTGVTAETTQEMWENWFNRDRARGFQPTLTDVTISLGDGIVTISGVLDYGNGPIPFETSGELYHEQSPMFNSILVDMNGFGNISIAGFMMTTADHSNRQEDIDAFSVRDDLLFRDNLLLTNSIVLQRVDNHQLMRFELPMSFDLFDAFRSSVRSENRLVYEFFGDDLEIVYEAGFFEEAEELRNKIRKLMIGTWLHNEFGEDEWYEDEGSFYESSSFSLASESGLETIEPFREWSDWTSLIAAFNGLPREGSIRVADFNVNPRFFSTLGWHHDRHFSWGSEMSYHAVVNTWLRTLDGAVFAEVTLIHFEMSEVPAPHHPRGDWDARIQARYAGGFMAFLGNINSSSIGETLSMNHPITQRNAGSIIDQFDLTIYMPDPNTENGNIFIERTQTMIVHGGNTLPNAFMALVPFIPGIGSGLDAAINVISHLQPSPSMPSGDNTFDYPMSVDLQHRTFNGNIIRGINVNTGSSRLTQTGHTIRIAGIVRMEGNATNPHLRGRYNFRATGYFGHRTSITGATPLIPTIPPEFFSRVTFWLQNSNPVQRSTPTPYRIIEVPHGQSLSSVTSAFPAPCRLRDGYIFMGWVEDRPVGNIFLRFFS